MTKFALAINEKWKDAKGEARESVFFAECEAWGKTGETIAKYTKKGDSLWVEAKAQTQEWNDKETGDKRTKTVFNVRGFQFVGGRAPNGESSGGDGERGASAGGAQASVGTGRVGSGRAAAKPGRMPDPNETLTQKDIPF